MLERELATIFKENDWKWNLKDGGRRVPEEEDFEQALDEAARILYDKEPGTQLEVGRLIIRKLHHGHDVYVFAGHYL